MAEETKGPGMFGSIFKSAKNLIFEEEQAAPAAQPGATPVMADRPAFYPSTPPAGMAPQVPASYPSYGAPQADPKMLEYFQTLVEKHNVEGNDYFEFRRTLNNMAAMPMPDQAKYSAAYFALMPISVEKIQQSALHYIEVIKQDSVEVAKEAEARRLERVGGLQKQAQKLEEETQALEEQIAAIRHKQQENAQQASAFRADAQATEQKIADKQQAYDVSMRSFIDTINTDLRNVAAYVTPLLQAAQPQTPAQP
jgi:Skp family chaperone for outer membrane proteins